MMRRDGSSFLRTAAMCDVSAAVPGTDIVFGTIAGPARYKFTVRTSQSPMDFVFYARDVGSTVRRLVD
jgi:hypothetical protein